MAGVARMGTDTVSTGHLCDTTTHTLVGSSSVFVNGVGACRKGDAITIHKTKVGDSCVPHSANINAGSSTVFVDGFSIARNGDAADAGSISLVTGDAGDSGSISSGSEDVFAGGKMV